MLAETRAALAAVTLMVNRVLSSAPAQDQHSAINQQSKKSEVAWRNRQAKRAAFARGTLVIPSEVEESERMTLSLSHGVLRLRCATPRMTSPSEGNSPRGCCSNPLHHFVPAKIINDRVACLHGVQNAV
jgi:hypothetical protein